MSLVRHPTSHFDRLVYVSVSLLGLSVCWGLSMASHKVFTPSKDMGRSGQVSAAPNVSKPGDGSGQILRDVEAAHVLSQFYLALTGAPEKGTRK